MESNVSSEDEKAADRETERTFIEFFFRSLYFPISGEEFARYRCDWGKRIMCRGQDSMKHFPIFALSPNTHHWVPDCFHAFSIVFVSCCYVGKGREWSAELWWSFEFPSFRSQFSWGYARRIGHNKTWTIVIVWSAGALVKSQDVNPYLSQLIIAPGGN